MANIRDVAKLANCSIATVSKVLSNDPNFSVSESTINRVHEAVKQLGYVYKTRKTKYKIGIIVPLSFEYYADPFFGSILQSIEKTAEMNNIEISIVIQSSDLSRNLHVADENLKKLDGLIIMEELNKKELNHLSSMVENIITVDFSTNEFTSVGFNHAKSNHELMQHLIDMGYKKIAYIGGGGKDSPLKNQTKFMMYRESLFNANLEYRADYVKDCEWDINKCATMTRELLNMNERPDAIYIASDILASVSLGIIFSEGLNCPADIGIVGFNNIETSAHFVPPLTTMSIPTDQIGKEAVSQILNKIENKNNQILEINVPYELVIRQSTRNKK